MSAKNKVYIGLDDGLDHVEKGLPKHCKKNPFAPREVGELYRVRDTLAWAGQFSLSEIAIFFTFANNDFNFYQTAKRLHLSVGVVRRVIAKFYNNTPPA